MDLKNYDQMDLRILSNISIECLDYLDTSQYPFPNTLWHVKPAREITLKTTAMLLVAIPGIFLNSIILIILFKNKWLWSASNYLIGNLALIDLLTLIFCPWFTLIRDFYQNFVLKHFGCRFEGFLQASFLLAGVCAVILVSYDRLAAAALTVEARVTKKGAFKLIIASWIISSLLALPWTIKRTYMERQWLDYLETYCAEDVRILGIYWHFLVTLLVWVPLGLMVITYGAIMWRLECSVRKLSARGGGQSIARARGKAMRITAYVLLVAVIFRVPYTVLLYWRSTMNIEINAVVGPFSIMWFSAIYLMYLNSAINPLIYGFTNVRFRKAMERTPGVSCFRFGSWCCGCSACKRNHLLIEDRNMEKIFVIENSPRPNKKISHAIKNILHINKETVEFSMKIDEATTKPTKVTPLKTAENI